MRVHHFSAATFCPPFGARLGWGRAEVPCHCLLVEAPDGLVLVDTGLGTADLADPVGRLGAASARLLRPRLDPAGTAVAAVRRLGFDPADVRHVVLTHLDFDHVGGLADFPNARAHVTMQEQEAAALRTHPKEKLRYRPEHVDHWPRWTLYAAKGERWMGFEAVRGVQGLADEVLLVPLFGHTRGHTGVVIPVDDGYLFHVGDAIFHERELTGAEAPFWIERFEALDAMDDAARRANRARLAALARDHADRVRIVCSHDPDAFHRHAEAR